MEFDRVHYPLPLVLNETPDAKTLQRTVERLTQELESHKKLAPDFNAASLLQENEDLRMQVRKLEHNQNLAAVPRKSAVEIDGLIHDKKSLEEENERLLLEHAREQKRLSLENERLRADLLRLKGEMEGIIEQLEAESEERANAKDAANKA